MHRLRHALTLTLALAAAIVLPACGGSGGDEDPREVLRETFSNPDSVESGVFDLQLKVDSEGGGNDGNVDIALEGPFQGGGDGLPQFNVIADVSADTPEGDVSFAAGLLSTGDDAFVNFQDTDYAVPQELFDQFATTFTRLQRRGQGDSEEDGNFIKQLGIDPTDWLADLENNGDEDVEGTETTHISGSADVPKLLEDIQQIAERAGPQVQPLAPEQLSQAEESIDTADLDVYSGVDDRLLRRISAKLELTPVDAPDSPDSVSIDFSLTLSEVNEPQTIEAPADAEPLGNLLSQFGLDPGQLGGNLRGGLGGGGGQSGGSPAAPSDEATQAYLDCLQTAEGADALQECAELIQ